MDTKHLEKSQTPIGWNSGTKKINPVNETTISKLGVIVEQQNGTIQKIKSFWSNPYFFF